MDSADQTSYCIEYNEIMDSVYQRSDCTHIIEILNLDQTHSILGHCADQIPDCSYINKTMDSAGETADCTDINETMNSADQISDCQTLLKY